MIHPRFLFVIPNKSIKYFTKLLAIYKVLMLWSSCHCLVAQDSNIKSKIQTESEDIYVGGHHLFVYPSQSEEDLL